MHEGVLLLGGVEVGDEEGRDEVGEESVEDGKENEDGCVRLEIFVSIEI